MRKSVQLSASARRRCPGFGALCFLCVLASLIVGTERAFADTPLPAIKTTQLAAPISVLSITSPYLLAAATATPKVQGFTLSQEIRELAAHVERLANYGVDLNQRKIPRTEKLHLRVRTSRRGVGGVVQLLYQR